jgi:hypothetical protein
MVWDGFVLHFSFDYFFFLYLILSQNNPDHDSFWHNYLIIFASLIVTNNFINKSIMPTMINREKEMIRISPKDSKKLEFSTNQGRTWIIRYPGSSNTGVFSDLMDGGKELMGTTDKGLFFSMNEGRTWIIRKRN